MFFYSVQNIIREKELRRQLSKKFSKKIVNETSCLLPKILEASSGENSDGEPLLSKLFFIPQRYVLGIMGFFAIVNAYTMRVCLSVAITEMVEPPDKDMLNITDACLVEFQNDSEPTFISDNLYKWNNHQQGLILSSFYWGYVLTHVPGAMIAEKFGAKHVVGLGILCTSIFTFATPFVIYLTDGNWIWVVVLRILEGLGEGTTFPALNAMLANWVPLSERSKIGTLVFAGSQIGTVAGNSISGALIHSTQSWASVFYFFGVFGVLFVITWTILCYGDPENHPFISDKERIYLEKQLEHVSKEKKDIPWKHILTSVPLWALVVAQIGHDWGFFTMVTDLPKYMKEVLRFNVRDNGILSSIPYVLMWIVSLSSGWFCDWLILKKYIKLNVARKLFTTIATVGPGTFIVIASYTGCNRILAVVMFTIAMGFMGTFYCGMKVNVLDLSPNYAGTVMAIVNGVGSLTGIVVPYFIAAITVNHTIAQWRTVFWVTFAILLITNFIFMLFGSADVQDFDSMGLNDSPKVSPEISNDETKTNEHRPPDYT